MATGMCVYNFLSPKVSFVFLQQVCYIFVWTYPCVCSKYCKNILFQNINQQYNFVFWVYKNIFSLYEYFSVYTNIFRLYEYF